MSKSAVSKQEFGTESILFGHLVTPGSFRCGNSESHRNLTLVSSTIGFDQGMRESRSNFKIWLKIVLCQKSVVSKQEFVTKSILFGHLVTPGSFRCGNSESLRNLTLVSPTIGFDQGMRESLSNFRIWGGADLRKGLT